jgi:hypothetical protein
MKSLASHQVAAILVRVSIIDTLVLRGHSCPPVAPRLSGHDAR